MNKTLDEVGSIKGHSGEIRIMKISTGRDENKIKYDKSLTFFDEWWDEMLS